MIHSKSRYVFGFLFLALLFLAFYTIDFLLKDKPYQTLTPEVYKAGTVVYLYDKLPRLFPSEFVLDNYKLDYVGEVKVSDEKIQTTVTFLSPSSIPEITEEYRDVLSKQGWYFEITSTNPQVSLLTLQKNNKTALITVSVLNEKKSMITIQYDK